jgi:hypothetical protein
MVKISVLLRNDKFVGNRGAWLSRSSAQAGDVSVFWIYRHVQLSELNQPLYLFKEDERGPRKKEKE